MAATSLSSLAGTWRGSGFNFIAVPDHSNQTPFLLLTTDFTEELIFTPISESVLNRGDSDPDITLEGQSYLQTIHANDHLLHLENGVWINTTGTNKIFRHSVIPHGNSLIASGDMFQVVTPIISPVSSIPIVKATNRPETDPIYLQPYNTAVALDPTILLRQAIATQNIIRTDVFHVSSAPPAILNIHFLTKNASAVSMDAIFWVESIPEQGLVQLQYTQTVMLDFGRHLWPHISVATLTLQP